jgi:large-conductance mechanosensitive channel
MIALLQSGGISAIIQRIIAFIRSLLSQIAQAFRSLFSSSSVDLSGLLGTGNNSNEAITAGNTTITAPPVTPAAQFNYVRLLSALAVLAIIIFLIVYARQRYEERQSKKSVLGSHERKKERTEKKSDKEEMAEITAEAVVKALLQTGFLHDTAGVNVEKVPQNEYIDMTEGEYEEQERSG